MRSVASNYATDGSVLQVVGLGRTRRGNYCHEGELILLDLCLQLEVDLIEAEGFRSTNERNSAGKIRGS